MTDSKVRPGVGLNPVVVGAQVETLVSARPNLDFLSDQEQQWIARCRVPAEKNRRLAGRLLLHQVLAHFYGLASPAIGRDDRQRPFLAGPGESPDFNLSHSGNWVLMSCCPQGRTGIDVEQTARVSWRLLSNYLHDTEKAALAHLPSEKWPAHLTRLWTAKEAYAKALGLGLGLGFAKIAFTLGPNGTTRLSRAASSHQAPFRFWALDGVDYQGTVCFSEPGPSPLFFTWSASRGWTEGLRLS